MNAHTLKEVLVDELGGAADGEVVTLAPERRVTIMVRFGDDLIPVTKVQSVRFGTVVRLVGETEQFFVDGDCDFLVKAEDAKKRDDARPGFH